MSTNRIRVLIVSQQVLWRQGLELVLSSVEDTEILCATAFNNGILISENYG